MSAWKEMMMAETEEEYRMSRSERERECREDYLRDEEYEGRLVDDEEQTMSDLIRREDAIKALEREKSDWNCDYNVPIDNCIKRLKKVKSADRPSAVDLSNVYSTAYKSGYEKGKADRPQEWIPCSERLPKIGEVVLVTWEWKCKKYITTAYMVTIRGVTYWDSKLQHKYEPLNVLAWMPLPKPWKGADDD